MHIKIETQNALIGGAIAAMLTFVVVSMWMM